MEMNNTSKISIIVPVYNTEKYLKECIDSIINQTYKNLEIILIDDGSTDNSLNICKLFSSQDKRIKIIEKSNSGVSDSRNMGLVSSTGDYITFVDSDDWIENNYIMNLFNNLIANNVDISMCNFNLHSSNNIIKKKNFLDNNVYYEDYLLNPFSKVFCGGICGKLYNKKIINFQFDKDIKIGEDRLFWFQAVLKAKKVYVFNDFLYNYRLNENSAMQTMNFYKHYNDYTSRIMISKMVKHNKALYKYNILAVVEIAVEVLNASNNINNSAFELTDAYSFFKKNIFKYLFSNKIKRNRKMKALSCLFNIKLAAKIKAY